MDDFDDETTGVPSAPTPEEQAASDPSAEVARLRESLRIADVACRSYWGWEWGPPNDNEQPDPRTLLAWKRDYDARAAPAAAAGPNSARPPTNL